MTRNPRPVESLLLPLKNDSLQCLHRLIEYERGPMPRFPRSRRAAVAVILFVGRLGDLYVLLSTRASKMRTYANDTALPGGKCEDGDKDDEATARREAYEEIGLPIDSTKVRMLTLLDPFLTGNSLIVTPVVLLVTDNAINPVLNPTEVVHLFSMPLTAFLYSRPSLIPGWHFGMSDRVASAAPNGNSGADNPDDHNGPNVANDGDDALTVETTTKTTAPARAIPRSRARIVPPPPEVSYASGPGEVGGKEGRYYQYRDVDWGPGPVRMHRFLTGREAGGIKPVYGLTAAILVHAATIGFAQRPSFPFLAPGQKSMVERIKWEVERGGVLRTAMEEEGLVQEWIGLERGEKDRGSGQGQGLERGSQPGPTRAKL